MPAKVLAVLGAAMIVITAIIFVVGWTDMSEAARNAVLVGYLSGACAREL